MVNHSYLISIEVVIDDRDGELAIESEEEIGSIVTVQLPLFLS
jgi:hypothetical protein